MGLWVQCALQSSRDMGQMQTLIWEVWVMAAFCISKAPMMLTSPSRGEFLL